MNNNTRAHILRYDVSYLTKTIVPNVVSSGGSEDTFFLTITPRSDLEFNKNENQKWMRVAPKTLKTHYLKPSLWMYLPIDKFSWIRCIFSLASVLFSDLSICSLMQIWKGPKEVVIHGFLPNFWSLIFMRLMGKRIVYIHWGGNIRSNGRFWLFRLLALRFSLKRIYVLMSPELRYFKGIVPESRLALKPYWGGHPFKCNEATAKDVESKAIILGNNRYGMPFWTNFLEKLKQGEFDSITCMLNYGGEFTQEDIDSFVRKWTLKFGDTFNAWTQLVPLEEYYSVMRKSRFYLCPMPQQSGLGALYTAIEDGKALFLRGDNLKWMEDLGIRAADLDSMKDFSYTAMSKFLPTREEAEENVKKLNARFVRCKSDESWYSSLFE